MGGDFKEIPSRTLPNLFAKIFKGIDVNFDVFFV